MQRPLAICLGLLALAVVLVAAGVADAGLILLVGCLAMVFVMGWMTGRARDGR